MWLIEATPGAVHGPLRADDGAGLLSQGHGPDRLLRGLRPASARALGLLRHGGSAGGGRATCASSASPARTSSTCAPPGCSQTISWSTCPRSSRREVRALPEGTVFFPNEPIMEVSGPILHAQLLETYLLNILGFSIIEATLAARMMIAARGVPVVDFGLRRCQGPISSIRAARGGQIAGFAGDEQRLRRPAAGPAALRDDGPLVHRGPRVRGAGLSRLRRDLRREGDSAGRHLRQHRGNQDRRPRGEGLPPTGESEIRGIRLDSGDLVELSRVRARPLQEAQASSS